MNKKTIVINLNSGTLREGNKVVKGFNNRNTLNLAMYEAIGQKHRVEYSMYKYLYAKVHGKDSIK